MSKRASCDVASLPNYLLQQLESSGELQRPDAAVVPSPPVAPPRAEGGDVAPGGRRRTGEKARRRQEGTSEQQQGVPPGVISVEAFQQLRHERYEGQFFKTKLCAFWQRSACTRGSACKWAHGDAELQNMPDLTNTSFCRNLQVQGVCNVRGCPFAHSPEELRATDRFYKTAMCKNSSLGGRCPLGVLCRHAHDKSELRQVGDNDDDLGVGPGFTRAVTQPAPHLSTPTEGVQASDSWGRQVSQPARRGPGQQRRAVDLPGRSASESSSYVGPGVVIDARSSQSGQPAHFAKSGGSGRQIGEDSGDDDDVLGYFEDSWVRATTMPAALPRRPRAETQRSHWGGMPSQQPTMPMQTPSQLQRQLSDSRRVSCGVAFQQDLNDDEDAYGWVRACTMPPTLPHGPQAQQPWGGVVQMQAPTMPATLPRGPQAQQPRGAVVQMQAPQWHAGQQVPANPGWSAMGSLPPDIDEDLEQPTWKRSYTLPANANSREQMLGSMRTAFDPPARSRRDDLGREHHRAAGQARLPGGCPMSPAAQQTACGSSGSQHEGSPAGEGQGQSPWAGMAMMPTMMMQAVPVMIVPVGQMPQQQGPGGRQEALMDQGAGGSQEALIDQGGAAHAFPGQICMALQPDSGFMVSETLSGQSPVGYGATVSQDEAARLLKTAMPEHYEE